MPTDTSAGTVPEDGAPRPEHADDLSFAAHDLGRDRPVLAPNPSHDVGFAMGPRPGDVVPPPPPSPAAPDPLPSPARADDGFVIRETGAVAPRAAVDALVVGATPAAAPTTAIVPRPGFRVHSASSPVSTIRRDSTLPWTVRNPSPEPTPSRRGWSSRQSGLIERSALDTLRRLREDAVHVSWKAAWIAVTSADGRLYKRRDW